MRKFYLVLLMITSLTISGFSQKFTISGYVKDKQTGEYLFGANVYLKENMKGAQTNQYGYYAITADKGSYTLVVSYMGYVEHTETLELKENKKINIELDEKVITKQEVVITGEKDDKNTSSVDMGKVQMDVEKIKSLPAFMGEVDIMKTIQLTPGVQSAGEGNSSFYVRGGGPDQNLILLDEAVVYNASHLFGFFSVFNADAVKNIELTKAGMPANYGGRLASVLDISMKEGNSHDYHVDGGIGLISSRLTVQGPVKKDTSSFIISARRTYIDLLMKPFIKKTSAFKGTSYYFYDLNTKINYRLSDKDRIFLSGYFGRDIFSLNQKDLSFKNTIEWGNATTSFRWNHVFAPKLFLNTSIIYSNYQFEMGATQSDYDIKLYSGVTDYNGKLDFSYFPDSRHKVKFGGNYIYHIFTPNNATAKTSGVDLDLGDEVRLFSNDVAIYANDEWDVNDKIKINGGLRYTYFQFLGPFDRFILNSSNQVIDSIHYGLWENIKTYNHLEPRLSMRYGINEVSSIKASFSQNYQYIHLASVTAVSLPTDIWVPSTDIVKPQFGTQYSLGYFRNFRKNMWESSVEVYYKDMKNQIEFKEGSLPEDNIKNNTDNNMTFGRGWSYGAEFFVNKRTGQWTGWLGYTLSYTKRKFPEINGGKEYWAKYDRRHDVSFILSYEYNEKWTFSAIWVYATGNAMTLPISRYVINGAIVSEYGPKNDYRMPAYHRADISATYTGKKHKKYESSWNFSIYNLYNRYNPYYIYFQTTGTVAEYHLETQAKQVSLFPILPSVTWNFKF
ncbi:MAG TPA: TonB-dependent receptor [Bacteroidales bacterium]|nr:TonB-dependent receptor [Bacteroidales bacterium]